MAGERREVPLQKHAYRCFCAYSPVECLSRMGMGYRRQRAGTRLPEEIRIGDGIERAHPPDYAEDRRQRDISHRDVHCLPPAGTRLSTFAGADEGARREIA